MMKNELKKIMNDNRNDIAKASRFALGIILGAVILIGVIFYGIAPKTRKKDDTKQQTQSAPAAQKQTQSPPPQTEVTVEEEPLEIPQGHLYRVSTDTGVTDKDGGYIGAATEGELFTSYDALDISEFGMGKQIEVSYLSQTGYIPADDLTEVMTATILPSAGDCLMKDEYSGTYPCSSKESAPITAAALVNSQKLRQWNKADLISAEEVLDAANDPVKLINDYSGGDLVAERVEDVSEEMLRAQIDSGKRVMLAVRYYEGVADYDYSDYYGITTNTQYVLVCGYDTDDEYGNIFYCCDPFYGQNGRSLTAVSADTLCTSAGLVDSDRKGMIILH
ncbi:hypothetical protein [Ruminococcus sp.]|uniref:hypothetical protein n=1 Tax=Ruminococcus sp. TaxID=41978 RepID=UPI0025E76BFD|nr:hypothetical protein [Ruminococcus sp.]